MTTVEYSPPEPLSNPEASKFVPTYLHTGGGNASGRADVRIKDDFYGTRRKLRIAVVGAGGSGLQFLHDAQRLKDVEIVVYDRNHEVRSIMLFFKTRESLLTRSEVGWGCSTLLSLALMAINDADDPSGAQQHILVADATFHLMFISFAGVRMRGQKSTLRNQSYCSTSRLWHGRTTFTSISSSSMM